MRGISITIVFFLVTSIYSQNTIEVQATIIDSKSNEPVSFVNIGFTDRGIGTVSDDEGYFSLSFKGDVLSSDDFLTISSMGYETKKIPKKKLYHLNAKETLLFLVPSEISLPQVFITSAKWEYQKLGSESYSLNDLGYWQDKDALGGELATRIEIDNRKTRLHDFRFNILENASDSLLVRINVYNCERNMPGSNILKENIYHTIKKKRGVDTVALKKHNIVVDDDVVIGMELVEVYGDALYLSVSATPFGGTAYLRELSHDNWDVRWGFGLGFGLLSSYPAVTKQEDDSVSQ